VGKSRKVGKQKGVWAFAQTRGGGGGVRKSAAAACQG